MLRTEDEMWENQRKPYIEELKEELKEIESSRLKNPAFVKFVLNKYPPKEKKLLNMDRYLIKLS